MTDTPIPPTLGLVLAGGLARRMGGGDKARIEIGGVTILDRVLATLSGQCTGIIINANGDPETLRRYRLDRGARQRAGLRRPARRHSRRARLAGGTEQRHRMAAERAGRLPVPAGRSGRAAASGAAQDGRRRAAGLRALRRMASSGRRPVAAGAARDLRKALVEEDLRKIEVWTARHGVAIAEWPDEPIDPFFNVNTPEDAERAEHIALQHHGI